MAGQIVFDCAAASESGLSPVGQIVFHCAAASEAGLRPAGQIVFDCAAASGITHWVTASGGLRT